MKLTCDLCDGILEMSLGGQGAQCADCGLYYPMARLREKLAVHKASKKPVAAAPAEPVVEAPVEPVVEAPVEPVVEAPVGPVVEAPAAPVWSEPVVEAPVEPVVEAPVEPVWSEPVVEAPAAPVWSEPVEPMVEAEPVAETGAAIWAEPVEAAQEAPAVLDWRSFLDPSADAVDAPVWNEPAQPVAEAPAAPVWSEPVAEAPTAPVWSEPVVEAPAAPVWSEPVVEAPAASVWSEPVVEAPVAPVWSEPVVEAPAAPVWSEPVVEAPVVPVWSEPVVEAPAAPVWSEPVVEAPAAPVWSEPVVPKKVGFSDRSTWTKPADRLVGNIPEFAPKQFVMHNNSIGGNDLRGWIQQGGVGIGDKVYFDGNYSRPYTVCFVNDGDSCAKAGSQVRLELAERVSPSQLQQVRTVYGTPTPIVNAYNYAGTEQQFFDFLLVNAFPQYEIFSDVQHSELKIPINYLFCKNGKPVLAVFLINYHSSQDIYYVKKATRIFSAEGISCTHFFDSFRSDTPYVIKRVQAALG